MHFISLNKSSVSCWQTYDTFLDHHFYQKQSFFPVFLDHLDQCPVKQRVSWFMMGLAVVLLGAMMGICMVKACSLTDARFNISKTTWIKGPKMDFSWFFLDFSMVFHGFSSIFSHFCMNFGQAGQQIPCLPRWWDLTTMVSWPTPCLIYRRCQRPEWASLISYGDSPWW